MSLVYKCETSLTSVFSPLYGVNITYFSVLGLNEIIHVHIEESTQYMIAAIVLFFISCFK